MKGRILVVDDEESIRYTFKTFLEEEDYGVVTAEGCSDARALIADNEFDLVFADILLGDGTGVEILQEVRRKSPNCPVIMFTGAPSVETSAEAVRYGAYDYMPKPMRQETILRVTKMALEHKRLIDEKERYRSNLDAIFRGIKDAIVMVNREGTIVEANEAVGKVLGYGREELIGKRCEEFSGLCRGVCFDLVHETLRTGRPVDEDHVECRGNGLARAGVISISASPLTDGSGEVSGAVLVVKDKTRLAELERELAERKYFHHIIGRSPKMQEIYSLIESLSGVDSTVLITGESGTGKELVAEALHYMGPRSGKPFVKVNCSALMESLLESELFGHARGAFTGALGERRGRFETAQGGTILLDEIGDISHALQLRLLRVLQTKQIERVGDSTPINVDVRVIASTNRNLKDLIKEGRFREDLYYRIKVVEMHLPPLRQRKEDIPLLVEHFLNKLGKRLNKKVGGISREVLMMFVSHHWPGNVRELENVLEHAMILCQKDVITIEDLPKDAFEPLDARERQEEELSPASERQRIINALRISGGNKAKAARSLGISRRTIYRKLREFGIEAE